MKWLPKIHISESVRLRLSHVSYCSNPQLWHGDRSQITHRKLLSLPTFIIEPSSMRAYLNGVRLRPAACSSHSSEGEKVRRIPTSRVRRFHAHPGIKLCNNASSSPLICSLNLRVDLLNLVNRMGDQAVSLPDAGRTALPQTSAIAYWTFGYWSWVEIQWHSNWLRHT